MDEVVADTHAILWYIDQSPQLSLAARTALDRALSSSIYVSAISLVEVAYLIDKKTVDAAVFDVLLKLTGDPASGIVLVPVEAAVATAVRLVPRRLVPDMPDRIITATAVHLGLSLVTADSKIRASGIATIW